MIQNSDQVYNQILKMRQTASRNSKLKLLKEISPIYLKLAYHPHWTYQFTKSSAVAMFHGNGNRAFDETTFSMFTDLRDRSVTGKRAMNIVLDQTKTLSHWSTELLKCILFKDFKCGISTKSVLKLHPGLFPSEFCMKAEDYDAKRISIPCIGTPKVDGIRGIIRDRQFYSSSGRVLVGLDHILQEFDRAHLLDRHIWDGEIVVPGKDFDTASGLIRSKNPVPAARFRVFDIPSSPLPSLTRRLDDIKRDLIGFVFSTALPYKILYSDTEVQQYFVECLAANYEGAVIKNLLCPYVYNRSLDWQKLKVNDTKDIKVTGIEEGTGKNINRVGSLLLEGGSKCGIGLSDEQRVVWWKNPRLIVGKVCEFGYMEKSSKGKYRHPKLLRIRYDKS